MNKLRGLTMILVVVVAAVLAVCDTKTESQVTASQESLAPYPVWGYTFYADGLTPLPGCDVTVVEKATGETLITTSDSNGYYVVSLVSAWNYGDTVNVTAVKDTDIGWNENVITPMIGYVRIDVTLTATPPIPEFPAIVVPAIGIICVALMSRRKTKGV